MINKNNLHNSQFCKTRKIQSKVGLGSGLLIVCFMFILLINNQLYAETTTEEKKKPQRVIVTSEEVPVYKREKGVKYIVAKREKIYKMIALKSIQFETVKLMIAPIKSKDGILTYEKKKHAILVYDTPQVIKKIQWMLGQLDSKAVNIKITINHEKTASSSSNNLGVGFDYNDGHGSGRVKFVRKKGGKWVRPKTTTINIGSRNGTSISNTSQFIVTMSGKEAIIFSGKEQITPHYITMLNMIPNNIIVDKNGNVITYKNMDISDSEFEKIKIGSKLKVKPTLLQNGLIEIEVFPEISFNDNNGEIHFLKVDSLKTTVTVKPGRRINIGGMTSSNKDEYMNLFGPDIYTGSNNNTLSNKYLIAEIQ